MKHSLLNLFFLILIVNSILACSRVSGKYNHYSSRSSLKIPKRIALESGNSKGSQIFKIAQQLLGIPYAYGGNNLSGFDCSGLVQYSHQKAGVQIPRTSAKQYETAQTVSDLKQGDVVFFRLNRYKVSHVGIYAGQGWFIHAPSSGKNVMYSNLGEPFWQSRVVKVGRFY